MTILLLNGHGIHMNVDGAKLHIKDGRFSSIEEPKEYVFSPQRIDFDNIVIYGRSGNLSLESIRWLVKHGVQITILNWDGKLLTTILPPESVQVKTKFAQYQAFGNKELRLEIAKKFIEAKFERTQVVLDYLKQRYPAVEDDIFKHVMNLDKAKSIKDVMGVEGAVAAYYWQQTQKVIPDNFEFTSRCVGRTKRPIGACDPVNCMLNYGYALLEAECLRAINTVGLDAHVGFLHEMQTGKNSLAYDIQELFRFLIDLAIVQLIETESIDKRDFIRTESYTLRLRPTGARKVTQSVNSWLNKTVDYQGKEMAWNYLIVLKTRELAYYLIGKNKSLNFSSPEYCINRQDSEDTRKKILNISYAEWKKQGFSKGTLHYMKKNACSGRPFSLNKHVRERLNEWERSVKTQT